MNSPGVRVPRRDAESTRQRLLALGVLRAELEVLRIGEDVVFPVADGCDPLLATASYIFVPRLVRAKSYIELLPASFRAEAPRAFEVLGDIVLVKVPGGTDSPATAAIGQALLEFHEARAVFHDDGVQGELRTRGLRRIAGQGESLTHVAENGCTFWVDPAQAFFSPRLAHERARVVALVRPDENVADMFAGVGPFAVQCAKAGAFVEAVDLNPEAVQLGQRNSLENKVADRVTWATANARKHSWKPADRIIMNLPHGAHGFLALACAVGRPGAIVHLHEILPRTDVKSRERDHLNACKAAGRSASVVAQREVRAYSASDAHWAWDLRLE